MKLFFRQPRKTDSSQRKPIKLQIDHLEDRLTPSGFGPADGAYISEPWIGRYTDVRIQPTDQKIVAVGIFGTSSTAAMAIGRYDSQGNTDTGYGNGGVTTSSLGAAAGAQGTGLALQSDGSAIVSGLWYNGFPTQHFLARITINGVLDSSYGTGGSAHVAFSPSDNSPDFSSAVALQSTGKAVMASQAGSAVVARFTNGGALDTGKRGFGTVDHGQAIGYILSSFGGGFYDLAIQHDDKVVAVGYSSTANSGFLVARYTANGVLDTTFNGTGYTTLLPAGSAHDGVLGVTLQSDGKILTVGQCDTAAGTFDLLVSRFNTNGTLDTSFGGGAGYVKLEVNGPATPTNERGKDVVMQGDGKIVVFGTEDVITGGVDGPANVMVARLNPDGTLDSSFGNGGFKLSAPPAGHTFGSLLERVALESNGNIIIAGVDNDGTSDHPMLMRFFSTTPGPLGPVGSLASQTNGSGLRFADVAGTSVPGLSDSGDNTTSKETTVNSAASVNLIVTASHRQQAAAGMPAKSLRLAAGHMPAQTADAAFLALFPASRLQNNLVVI
jgi:uncharacterized delta-60 repeat protein